MRPLPYLYCKCSLKLIAIELWLNKNMVVDNKDVLKREDKGFKDQRFFLPLKLCYLLRQIIKLFLN